MDGEVSVPLDQPTPLDPFGEDPSPEASVLEPSKGSDSATRLSTYQANTLRWLESDPSSRFAAFRLVHATQQASVIALLTQVGVKWDNKGLARRAAGEEPRYRGHIVHKGNFADPALQQYSSLVEFDI